MIGRRIGWINRRGLEGEEMRIFTEMRRSYILIAQIGNGSLKIRRINVNGELGIFIRY